MKTKCLLTVSALILFFNNAGAREIDSWSIQVSGMAHKISYSDFNDMVNSFNLTYTDNVNPEMKSIDMTYGLNMEVLFRMNRFQVGFGIGYIMTPEFEYKSGPNNLSSLLEDYELKHAVNAKIFSVIGTYDIVSKSKFIFYGGAGIAYYLSSITFNEFEIGDPYGHSLSTTTVTKNSELVASKFGLMGLLGLETKLTSRISFDIRLDARLASISGFMGTQQRQEVRVSTTGTTTEKNYDEGVYLIRQEMTPGEVEFGPNSNYPLGTDAHKEGKVNLSGFGIQVGLKFHFPK